MGNRIIFVAGVITGAVVILILQWGVGAYRQYVIDTPGVGYGRGILYPQTIAKLGRRVVPALCMQIARVWENDGGQPRAKVAQWTGALGLIGDRRGIPTLIALADHQNPVIRYAAVWAMHDMPDGRCLPALRRLAEDPDELVRTTAEDTIKTLATRGAPGQ